MELGPLFYGVWAVDQYADLFTLLESKAYSNSTFQRIRPFAIDYCKKALNALGYETKTQCPGLIDLYGPVVQSVLVDYTLQSSCPCEKLNLCPDDAVYNTAANRTKTDNRTKWNNKGIKRKVKFKRRPSQMNSKATSSNIVRVLQVSDIHMDIKYKEGSPAKCDFFLCCRGGSNGTGKAGKYGTYGCDLPRRTVDVVLKNIRKLRPKPDLIIYTGDSPPHDVWDQSYAGQLKTDRLVIKRLTKVLHGIPVLPALGNHGTFPQNLYSPDDPYFKKLNKKLANHWRGLFPERSSQWRSIVAGAYYSYNVRPGLRVISINTQFWYTFNFYTLTINKAKVYRKHLKFIRMHLRKARKRKEKVILMGHIPPGDVGSITLAYGDFHTEMVNKFHDVIVLQVSARDDIDDVRGVLFIAPSVTTYSKTNPSFRMYHLDGSSYQLLDYEQYFMNLTAANDFGNISMKKLYSAQSEYNLTDMSPESFLTLSKRLEDRDDEVFTTYRRNMYVGGPVVPESRLQTLFQQLEKIGGKAVRNQTSTEDLQQIRYVTSKIHQIFNTQEKLHRDTVLKNPSWIDLVLLTLKNTADRSVQLNLIQVLLELAGKTQVGKRVGILVSANTSNVLFQLIYREAEDQASLEDTVMLSHQVLAKLAQKDRKFATKARLNSVLVITLNLIKNNLYNFRNLQPLLQVFKAYTNNSVNSSYLGKHNSIPPMLRVIQQCGRKHTAVLKLALDILTNLTKSRNNAARTIGGEHVPHLLALYHDWHQIDTKHRYISLRKAILSILKNITNLRSGRKALVDANGIQVLYDSAQEVIDCREMESLILLASVIMRKCCPRNKLPLTDLRSAVSHELPMSELYPEISQSDPSYGFGGFTETQDSDNSSLEDDDDIDSDDERFKTDHMEEVEDDQVDTPEPFKRTADDLRMYDNFFPELFEIEIQDEDDSQTSDQLPTSIYIPTGNYDTYQMSTASTSTQDKTLYRMTSCISYASSKTSGYSSLQYDTQEYTDSYPPPPRCDSATAINMKTGTSVFSLDIPVSQPTKSTSTKPKTSSQQKSTSVSKKQKGSKKTSKDRKKKSSTSLSSMGSVGNRLSDLETEFSESLYISPYNTSSSNNLEEGGGDSSEEDDADSCHDSQLFQDLAGYTKSVYRFEKLAFPDLYGGKSQPTLEPLFHRKFGVQRVKVFEDIDRMIHPENVIDRDVFDLDSVVKHAGSNYTSQNSNLSNRDQLRIGNRLDPGGASSLKFNSQFESGNLRKAVWVRDFEYDLILNPDVNTNHHHQWFYFEVSNMLADAPYRFNIVNCEKLNSQFNFGMKPVMFSVTEAIEGRPYWFRTGTDICYYRNHFTRSPQATGGVKGKTYYTATFTVTFKHNKDICYLAYHYPYTYTTLQTHLYQCERSLDHNQIFFRRQSLCQTLMGNDVPVLTITARPKSSSKDHVEELRSRPYIFLSGRVHPGESNSSWVMKGTIDFLLSKKPAAQQLRESYIFKIIPMLNPDGVINGCHRCSMAAEDLNRRWDNPCPKLHPTIYHTKGLLQYLQMINKVPMVYCDYHGHSRRKNIFIYGCSPSMSWIPNDTENPACSGNRTEDNGFKTLPRILHLLSPTFSWPNCSFIVEKAKETTARVVVWRQIGVVRSYTMESTYCGIDKDGKLKDQHISTLMLEEMGYKFCEGLLRLRSKYSGFDNLASFPAGSGTNQAEGTTTGRQRGDDLFDENLNEEEDNMEMYAADDLDDETSDDDDMYEDEENYDEDA
ncbi:hypothetical protein FSP39_016346 [Pinctada imbricata]|uniref:tubulin-glutamate carboxypeptidase n=1 Tax=Pinctada imbricata TaxID=66713 RepID=A0AA88Y599_PINIB|nr:hypothetical protein FSP39_016346 [Pinctada imbricata]